MKNVLMAVVSVVGIIVVRVILSIAFTDQIAEVFARTAIGILFFYLIASIGISSRKRKLNQKEV